ncbi:MAG: DUF2975 domain-containing protein [Eubacteriales bacterium]
MQRKITFDRNKNLFTAGQILIGLALVTEAVSIIFISLSFVTAFDSHTILGSLAKNLGSYPDYLAAKAGWLGVDIPAESDYGRQISLYANGDRVILLVLILFVITKFKKIVAEFEDHQQIFLEKNVKSLRHIGHAVVIYMLTAFTYNLICSFFLHMAMNTEFTARGLNASAFTYIEPFFFLFCFIAAGTAYSLSAVFQKGFELRQDNESFI